MSWRPPGKWLTKCSFIMQNLLPAQTPLGSNTTELRDRANDKRLSRTRDACSGVLGVESGLAPVQQGSDMKPFLVSPFLLSFTVAQPCISRCRPSTWLISKWDARRSQIHPTRGLFTLLASPGRKNFAGPVEQRVWSRAFSMKQMKPF